MKIKEIQAVRVNFPAPEKRTEPRRKGWAETAEVANPMSWYPKVKRHRSLWTPKRWGAVWCKVTLEDGTWGLGLTDNGRVAAAIIDDHIAPNLIGEDGLAVQKLSDMMFRMTKPYGSVGLAAYAVSAVDLALWDAKGKLLGRPVYSLIGGPQKEKQFCYSTGNDLDWYKELGFRAFKLACPYGPADGLDGLRKNEQMVAEARELVGDEVELMLDCWMAFDLEYTVRLADTLRPYRLKLMEESLLAEALVDGGEVVERAEGPVHFGLEKLEDRGKAFPRRPQGREPAPGLLCREGVGAESAFELGHHPGRIAHEPHPLRRCCRTGAAWRP